MKKLVTILLLLFCRLSFGQYTAYWTVISNKNITSFTIQSSNNQRKWSDIKTVPEKDSLSYNADFNTTDNLVRVVANLATTSFNSPIVQIVTTLPVGLSKIKFQKKSYQRQLSTLIDTSNAADEKQHLQVKGYAINGTLLCNVVSPRDEKVSIAISDIVGRYLSVSSWNILKGDNNISMPFNHPSGIYFLHAHDFLDNVITKFFNLR